MTLQETLPFVAPVDAKYAYSELVGLLPENKPVPAEDYDRKNFPRTALLEARYSGYNQALADFKAVLEEYFGVNHD